MTRISSLRPNVLTRFFQSFTRTQKIVLFAWELGGGLGHIQRLVAVANDLAARDRRVVFALQRVDNADIITRALPGAKVVRAPVRRSAPGARGNGTAYNYADVLHRCGYDAAENLGPVVSQWRELLQSVAPALVVADHSPTVVLAAAGRVPVVHIGSGFATPPIGRTLLALHPRSAGGAKEREAEVHRSIRDVHDVLGTPEVRRVSDLLGLAENITCCLPELDPYKSVRAEPAMGPVQKLPAPQPLNDKAPLFGYLNGDDPRTAHILESLAKASVPCGLYVRQCPPDWARLVTGSMVQLYSSAQQMPDAVANASAIVHHGGLSTTETALALGRPQFLFPRNLEQGLTAVAVDKLGCGVDLSSHGNPGDAIRRALTRGTYRKEAAVVAARIAARPAVDVTARIVAACAKYLTKTSN